MATKEQERKALEQIKKIVASLGEGSYVGMALEGCFSDAEQNIDDDAAFSMKDRWKSSEKKLAEAMETIAMLKEQCKKLAEMKDRAEERAIDPSLAGRIKEFYMVMLVDANEKLKNANSKVLEMIGNVDPSSPEMLESIAEVARLKRRIAGYEKIKEEIGRYA